MTRKQLLDQALEAVDGDGAELIKRLGMTNVYTAGTWLRRYPKGKNVSFDRTMALLRVAGLLREEPVAPLPDAGEVVDLVRRLADFLERLAPALPEPFRSEVRSEVQRARGPETG